jgi:hypothetical protein
MAGTLPGGRPCAACAAHPSRSTSSAASNAPRAMRTVAMSQWASASPGQSVSAVRAALIRSPPQLTYARRS